MSVPQKPPTGRRIEGIPSPQSRDASSQSQLSPDLTGSIHPETEDASETETSATGAAQLWEAAAPSRASRIMRAVFVVAIGILAVMSIVRIFAPRSTPTAAPVDLPQSWAADRAAAASVAENAARAYLTLNNRDDYQSGISQTWANPPANGAGWDGSGALTVLDSYVVRTTALDAQHVDVLVAVHVTNKGDEKAQTTVSGWIGVMVPVVVSAERASVAGEPALAGIPAPTQTARTERLDIDRDITDATRADAAAFVRAWAAGDAAALSAPGAEIDSPPTGLANATLDDWRVGVGEGQERDAQATITWTIGTSKITCHYRLTLTQVASGQGSRWQVQHLTTDTNTKE